jgi:hypothetical protein
VSFNAGRFVLPEPICRCQATLRTVMARHLMRTTGVSTGTPAALMMMPTLTALLILPLMLMWMMMLMLLLMLLLTLMHPAHLGRPLSYSP